MPGPTASDLIFSEQANLNFSKTLGELKRSTLSIRNRLQSIQQDAAFAERVAGAYGRPLIVNERCGSWYIDPKHKTGSAYFKSTDGHTGAWKLSTRRLNLHLLEIVGKLDGCIIVDSTRRGKNALSKTIPIWCSVVNRLLFPSATHSAQLYTPPQVVSQSEHEQITALLPSFLASLQSLTLPIDSLKSQILKPLRPVWVTPDSNITPTGNVFEDFHPIICCTVSRRDMGGELSGGGYIQGAGDDTENWACGLTPSIFWANCATLISTPESEMPGLIEELARQSTSAGSFAEMTCLHPTDCLVVGSLRATAGKDSSTCIISLQPKVTDDSMWKISSTRLDIGLGPHKLGSRNLRTALPVIVAFAGDFLSAAREKGLQETRIVVACENGKDLSIGAALALLCLLFAEDGRIRENQVDRKQIDKTFIRRRLGWISSTLPDANPSRATLQSVNSFLIKRP